MSSGASTTVATQSFDSAAGTGPSVSSLEQLPDRDGPDGGEESRNLEPSIIKSNGSPIQDPEKDH